jgi:hypothetical protein
LRFGPPFGKLPTMKSGIHACCLLAIVVALTACETITDPCDDARFACEDSVLGFALDPTCTLEGDLTVEVGQGESAFVVLTDNEMPTLVTGNQGGQHTFLAVRVMNAALDRYDVLKTRFAFYLIKPCGAHDGGTPVDQEKSGPEDDCRYLQNSRNLILGVQQPIRTVVGTTEAAMVEEFGVLIRTGDTPDFERELELQVDDPCGRRGFDRHKIAAR